MSGKVPGVSIVGGKARGGFEPLPNSEHPALAAAARKSRQHKNRILVKIGLGVLFISAALAGIAAFLLTRGEQSVSVPSFPSEALERQAMSDEITAVGQVKAVAHSNMVFSGRLYDLLRKEPGNIIMSPFSVSGVMAMLSAGAGGDTLSQVVQGMSFPESEDLRLGYRDTIPALRTNENFTLETANSIFAQAGFDLQSDFKNTLHQYFHASIQNTDFSENEKSARLINDWVEAVTQKKIKDLIQPDMLNALTRLVLVNAIYFKGDWEIKFDPKHTKEQDFHLNDGSKKQVPMMRLKEHFQYAELDSLDASMLELPYKGNRLVMQILLPRANNGLGQLEEKLRTAGDDLNSLFESDGREVEVSVQLPKFKLEKTLPLTGALQELGMTNMFASGAADFSGIDGSKQLYVSAVLQKAFIEVNEEGSEAAAATGAVMMMRSMPTPPEQFKADHPFIFFLRDKLTGMLLFQGRVEDPSI